MFSSNEGGGREGNLIGIHPNVRVWMLCALIIISAPVIPTIPCQFLGQSQRRKEKYVAARFYSSVILGYSCIVKGQAFYLRLKFAEI